MNTALVVAAHPDDEVLGCGATISLLSGEGWEVHVLIVAEGATSRSAKRDLSQYKDELSSLAKCAEIPNSILGTVSIELESLPDNRMDGIELLDLVKLVETEIDIYKPCLIFTHHAGDVNIDHRVLHDSVIAACRPQPQHSVTVYYFLKCRQAQNGVQRPPACISHQTIFTMRQIIYQKNRSITCIWG